MRCSCRRRLVIDGGWVSVCRRPSTGVDVLHRPRRCRRRPGQRRLTRSSSRASVGGHRRPLGQPGQLGGPGDQLLVAGHRLGPGRTSGCPPCRPAGGRRPTARPARPAGGAADAGRRPGQPAGSAATAATRPRRCRACRRGRPSRGRSGPGRRTAAPYGVEQPVQRRDVAEVEQLELRDDLARLGCAGRARP